MRITPLDIRKQEFRKAMRGVDSEEVYAFLTTVAEEYEAALSDNKALRERVLELDDKVQEYRTLERTLRDTLLTAERATANAKQNAQREADLIIKEAQIEAERTLRDIKSRMMRLRQEVQTLQRERESFLARMKMLADSFLKFIDSEERHFSDDEANDARLMAEPEAGDVSPYPPAPVEESPAAIPMEETPASAEEPPAVEPGIEETPPREKPSAEAQPKPHAEFVAAAASVAPQVEKRAVPDLNAILDRMVKEQREILNEASDAEEPEPRHPAAAEKARKEWSLEQLKKDIISE